MAVTINQNLVDETDVLANERVIDMSDVIDMLDPDETQYLTMLNKVSNESCFSSKVEWLEDQLFPRLAALGASAGSATSSISVAAGQSPYFRVGDLCRITSTGDAFRVVGVGTVSASILEVTRGVGTTAAGNAASSAEVVIVGNSSAQGASLGTRAITQRTTQYNYTQIFRNPYGFANTLIASKQYGGPILDRERHKKGVEHKRAIEQSLFFGARSYTNPGTPATSEPASTLGGLLEYIVTNSHNASGTYAFSTLETHLRADLQHGSKNKVVFASPMVGQVFSSYSITAWTRATPEQSVWGVHIDGLLSGAYGWGVPVFIKRAWNDFAVNTSGGYGGQAFVVDMDATTMRTLRSTQLLRGRQGNSEDQIVEEYLTEVSLMVETENKHSRIYNVTG